MTNLLCRRQRGFTLIEVIIAFALLALALTLLLGSLSGAARQIRTANDSGRATLHAQSLLAQLGVGEVLQPGRKQGVFEQGRYRWELQVEPYVDPLKRRLPQADVSAPRLLQLQLDVRWGDAPGQRLRWQTLRLAPADANATVLGP
ncbi:MAG: prepilin-type N-terminal cleavage/methylation domain-containing protein [Pseudoxanthomonas sp.]